MANRHSHTQTIAAPLYFSGNVPPNPGELSALDFLRQMEIRMLGNNIHEDAEKLSFALNALQGRAHEWYMGLKIRHDFVATLTFFKSRFCHKYRLPGYTPNEFDITLISTQYVEEDPEQYIARITNYMELSLIHI